MFQCATSFHLNNNYFHCCFLYFSKSISVNILFSCQFFENQRTPFVSLTITLFLSSTLSFLFWFWFWKISSGSCGASFLDLTKSQKAQVILLPDPLRAGNTGTGFWTLFCSNNCTKNDLYQFISSIAVKLGKANKRNQNERKSRNAHVVIYFIFPLFSCYLALYILGKFLLKSSGFFFHIDHL